MENPEKIEIEGLKTIHKLCKFGADHNMEGCTFTEIVERMFDELAKAQAVPEWISVEHQMPPIDEIVLVCWDHHPDIEAEKEYMTLDLNLNKYWPNCEDEPPTHWMLMLKPPKAQEPANDS